MTFKLNHRAADLVSQYNDQRELLGIERTVLPNGARIFDFGVHARGGFQAGIELAKVCLANLGSVSLTPSLNPDLPWPVVSVATDHPVPACLFSQYAGWEVKVGDYFGMGSGPMRAARAHEELFQELNYHESTEHAVGVLETSQLPTDEVASHLAEKLDIRPSSLILLTARTASIAGSLQIVARSVETALHKLHELKFDLRRIQHGFGTAPLPPLGKKDLDSIGRTNDAILYGGQVHLWVTGDDDSLAEIGPQVPSNSSSAYGETFLSLFKAAGYDFYKLDKMLFSPAEIIFQNISTGRSHRFGQPSPNLLIKSFA